MKGLSSKLILLILGIAVATAIAMAALLYNHKIAGVFSVIPRRLPPPIHAASGTLIKKVAEKIESRK